MLQRDSDLWYLLGNGESRQVILSDLPRFLRRKDQEGRSRFWDIRSFMQWQGKLMRTYVWGQSLEESSEYCTLNCRQYSELDSRRILGIFKIRSQSDAAGRNLKHFGRQVASLSCHYSQMKCVSMCQFLPFWFSKRMGCCLHVLGTGRGGYLEKNLSPRMCIQRTKVP